MIKAKTAIAGMILSVLAAAVPSFAQDTATAQTVVTVLPKGGEAPALQHVIAHTLGPCSLPWR